MGELIGKLSDRVFRWRINSDMTRISAPLGELRAAITRIAELEEGLRPFAEACTISNADDESIIDDTLAACKIKWKHIRKAHALLSKRGM